MLKEPRNKDKNFMARQYDYNYPEGLDLHPDSEDHAKLLKFLLDYVRRSYDIVSRRHQDWREIDRKVTAFIELDSEEEGVKARDSRKPVSLVVPMSYATLETLLTYRVAAYLRSPIFEYQPSKDSADLLKALVLQSLIERDVVRQKVGLDLYTMWMDEFKYGFGAARAVWIREMGFKTKPVYEEKKLLGVKYGQPRFTGEYVQEEVVSYEGNALEVIDPYNTLPDPNVPIHNFQKGEFFGYVDRKTFTSLMMLEKESEDDIFNVRYLKGGDFRSAYYSSSPDTTGRYDRTGIDPDGVARGSGESSVVDVIWIYVKIIPSDFGLGDYEYPEIWSFGIAGDRVIIHAAPLRLDFNKFPIAVNACEFDGHSMLPVSRLEIEYPLQKAVDWLWSSHQANVRKSVNNMIIYDPSVINSYDMVDSKSGLLARARPSAWGRDIRNSIFQLTIQDVTRGNVADMLTLMDISRRVMGTVDSVQGVQERRGERVSATEARDTRFSALSRLEKMAKISAMQGHYDIARMFASNTLQFMSEEQYVKISGDYATILGQEYGTGYFKVDLKEFDLDYDIVVQDGTIPGGEYADIWERLLAHAEKNPEIFQRIDSVRVWLHIARQLGAKNPSAFLKQGGVEAMQSRVAPDEEIDKKVQAGDAVPVEEFLSNIQPEGL